MEAQHLSDEDKESGKGRSQVMNLLIIDTGTIAGLATRIWNLTNALIGCKSFAALGDEIKGLPLLTLLFQWRSVQRCCGSCLASAPSLVSGSSPSWAH